jgi:plasmid stabilization system protein ParE
MRVIILHEAEQELREAVRFYEAKSPGLGLDFLDEIDAGLKTVAEMPGMWAIRKDGTRRYLVHRFPFVVVYLLTEDRLWIIAFAHCKRKSEYWRNRLK